MAGAGAACGGGGGGNNNNNNNSNNPRTLYEQCLSSLVDNTNYTVPSLERVRQLRYLPESLLIDVYELMSKRDHLKDALLAQLSDLEIFSRLLRYIPARSKLHHILGELTNSRKQLPWNLQSRYVMRFKLEDEPKVSKLSLIAKVKLQHRNKNKKANQEVLEEKKVEPEAAVSAATATAALNCLDGEEPMPSSSAAAAAASATSSSTTTLPTSTSSSAIATATSTSTQQAGAVGDCNVAKEITHANNFDVGNKNLTTNVHYNLRSSSNGYDIDPIDCGLRLGSFLAESGWMSESILVLQCVNERLQHMKTDVETYTTRMDCLQRLLHAQSSHCDFKAAKITVDQIKELNLHFTAPTSLKAITYTQVSAMYFARNEYDNSHKWSVMAMRELDEETPERIAIDVLRQAAKACVVKRDFSRANMLICQAVFRAREAFGVKHQKYGDALLDYGFFLLNVDSIYQSVVIYTEALEVRRQIFGNRNYHVAVAHEDLSYAYYVHEYSTGDFSRAQDHVDKAVGIMRELVPTNHLMLASAKRVKALLLEEIALDKMADGMNEEGLLRQSEELHKYALLLSLQVFGEVNVQTAKHYGNLGRLYQTMNRFDEAESMHQKAIKIKTDLLGPYDYEVGLSIGHLASLYNYQMKKYREAEDLYLRSIDISLRLFGRSYSGLEYDYLGLCHVYETLHEFEKYLRYANILENWQMLRGQNITQNSTYPPINDKYSLQEVKYKYFTMVRKNANDGEAAE